MLPNVSVVVLADDELRVGSTGEIGGKAAVFCAIFLLDHCVALEGVFELNVLIYGLVEKISLLICDGKTLFYLVVWEETPGGTKLTTVQSVNFGRKLRYNFVKRRNEAILKMQ